MDWKQTLDNLNTLFVAATDAYTSGDKKGYKKKSKEYDDVLSEVPTDVLKQIVISKERGSANSMVAQELADRYNVLPHEKKLRFSYSDWIKLVPNESKAKKLISSLLD